MSSHSKLQQLTFHGGPIDGLVHAFPETRKPIAEMCVHDPDDMDGPKHHYVAGVLLRGHLYYMGKCTEKCPGGNPDIPLLPFADGFTEG